MSLEQNQTKAAGFQLEPDTGEDQQYFQTCRQNNRTNPRRPRNWRTRNSNKKHHNSQPAARSSRLVSRNGRSLPVAHCCACWSLRHTDSLRWHSEVPLLFALIGFFDQHLRPRLHPSGLIWKNSSMRRGSCLCFIFCRSRVVLSPTRSLNWGVLRGMKGCLLGYS